MKAIEVSLHEQVREGMVERMGMVFPTAVPREVVK